MAQTKSKAPSSNSLIIMVIVGVLVGWIVGFAVGNTLAKDSDSQSSGSSMEDISGDPSVEISALEDTMGGFNVNIVATNFEFTPENAGGDNVENQGHAHIYVDGKKVGRVYGDWYYLPALEKGEHEITVSLNGNNHEPVMVNGEEVKTTVVVNVTESGDDHSHSEEEADHTH